jgi:hypothetical protein
MALRGIAHENAQLLVSTGALILHYDLRTTIPREDLEVAIPAAIDAVYGMRDRGGNMHSAGAAAAVEAVSLVLARHGLLP